MKKVSAFSVFGSRSRKKSGSVESVNKSPSAMSSTGSLQSINASPSEKKDGSAKGKRFLRALRGGNLRESLRSKGRKNSLSGSTTDSPMPPAKAEVGETVQLTEQGDGSQERGTPMGKEARKATPSSKSKKRKTLDNEAIARGNQQASPRPERNKRAKLDSNAMETDCLAALPPKPTLPPKPPKKASPRAAATHPVKVTSPKAATHPVKGTSPTAATHPGKGTSPKAAPEKKTSAKKNAQPEVNGGPPQFEETLSQGMHVYMYDSVETANHTFTRIIHPVEPDRFFKDLWERKPLLVKRHVPDYNAFWFSTKELDSILRKENVQFGVNLDVTSYRDGKRETHNPPGRAYAPLVWDNFNSGCSIRVLNPQTYSRNVWKLLSVLQEYFGCFVGANIYLTPPGTQGFAPHWDDIEAFVIQLEGKKHWRLYNPRNENETLPRYSSENLEQKDIGEPILDTVLEAGDLLYFPRGTIHQANALETDHSLHITVSCYQKNTWGDLLEKMLPQALAMAIEEDRNFRKGLPRDYLSYMGVVNDGTETNERKAFMKRVEGLFSSLVKYLPVDAACDQMGKQVLHDALPPAITAAERQRSIFGMGERWDPSQNRVTDIVEIDPDTCIKLIRNGVVRLVVEGEKVLIYHCLENSRVYRATEPQALEISVEMASAMEAVIKAYPDYVVVDELPLETQEDRIEFAYLLYNKGLVVTAEKLESLYEDRSDCENDENA